ncbi:histidine kinase N-terminal 7TM domain-containing protein [Leptospira sp. WS92.C1]
MISTGIGLIVFSLGLYVRIFAPKEPVRNSFFYLSISLSCWMFFLGQRPNLALEYRYLIINWTLLPIVFSPYLLHEAVCFLLKIRQNRLLKKFEYAINFMLLLYFLFVILSGNVVHIRNPENFSYSPTWNYHLIIGYCCFYILISCMKAFLSIFKSRGDDRVKAFLLFSGMVISFFVSIFFVYILPLFGYFLAPNAAFGIVISLIFGAIAILHYDAFSIRENILDGNSIPILTRFSSSFFLVLFRILDPSEYSMRLLISKANVVLGVVSKNHELAMRTDLETLERAEMVAGVYYDRLK